MRDDVLDKLRKEYSSLEEPTFYFSEKALTTNPYQSVIGKLGERFAVEDNTDTNYQICFEFTLLGKKHEYHLELSWVGPYGVLVSFAPPGRQLDKLLNDRAELDEEENVVKTILLENGIELLSRGELMERTPLNIDIQDIYQDESHQPKEVILYHALFSADRWIPWAR
jgi:hypothetical protein